MYFDVWINIMWKYFNLIWSSNIVKCEGAGNLAYEPWFAFE